MPNTTRYSNTPVDRAMGDGGAVRVTLASNVGQGNGGTSLPCRIAYVQGMCSNTSYVHMNIGAAATSVLGVCVPQGPTTTISATVSEAPNAGPMPLPIDDVSKLYFWGATDGDAVDILYIR